MNAAIKIEAPTGLALLRQPFPDHQISKLPKPTKKQTDEVRADFKKGIRCKLCDSWHHPDVIHLDYVGHAAATDRLLDADPEWSWEPLALGPDGLPAFDRNGCLWIRMTVCGVTRLGVGDADGKQGGNAVKEAIGDAIRNAGMRFGMALDLWHKGDLHIDADEGGAGETDPAQPDEMPAAEWAKLAGLLKATGVPAGALLKEYCVQSLKLLGPDQYANAVERLTAKLAEKAKAETNAKADAPSSFGELIDDEIPY